MAHHPEAVQLEAGGDCVDCFTPMRPRPARLLRSATGPRCDVRIDRQLTTIVRDAEDTPKAKPELIEAGLSVKTVQARLGHASANETLAVYSHLWPDSDDDTSAAIEHRIHGQDFSMTTNAEDTSQ